MRLDWAPLAISLKTALCATAIAFLLGIAAARWVASLRGRLRAFADGLFTLPMVLPPTVLGFFLLVLFGRHGPVGQALSLFRIRLIFSWPAAVIAATAVAFPLVYRTARASFEQLDPSITHAARTLGLSEWTIFWRVILPAAWPGAAAGTVLAFARALGEFGATLMVAGNIPGRTQTVPVAIFFAAEGGRMDEALVWVTIIVALSTAVTVAVNLLPGGSRAGIPSAGGR